MKLCSKCKEEKSFSEFTRRSDKPHLWRSHCKICIGEKNKSLYSKNRDKYVAQKATYNKEHREEINAYMRKRRATWTSEERQAQNDYLREWRRLNSDKVKDYGRVNRAKRKEAFVEHVPFETIWNRDEGVCQLCEKPIDPKLKFPDWDCATLDHIIPISKGGAHEMTNVCLAHWFCNWKKRDAILERM